MFETRDYIILQIFCFVSNVIGSLVIIIIIVYSLSDILYKIQAYFKLDITEIMDILSNGQKG